MLSFVGRLLFVLLYIALYLGVPALGAFSKIVKMGIVVDDELQSLEVCQLMKDMIYGMQAGVALTNAEGGMHNGTVGLQVVHVNPAHPPNNGDFGLALAGLLDTDPEVLASSCPVGNAAFWATLPQAEARDTVVMCPVAFDPQTYDTKTIAYVNLRNHPRTEWFGLISYLVGTLHLRRIAVFRTQYWGYSSSVDPSEYEGAGVFGEKIIVEALQGLGMELIGTMIFPNGSSAEAVGLKLTPFILTKKPQAILFPGTPDTSMGNQVGAIKLNPYFNSDEIYLVTGNQGTSVFETVFPMYNLSTKGKVLTSLEHPSSTNTDNAVVRKYRAAMAAIGRADRADSNVALTAFLIPRFFAKVIDSTPILTRMNLRDRIFAHSIFQAENNSYGMFSAECSVDQVALPLCNCWQGVKTSRVVSMSSDYKWTELTAKGANFQFSVTSCTPSASDLKRSTMIVNPNPKNEMERLAMEAGAVDGEYNLYPSVLSNISSFEGANMEITLANIIADHFVTAIAGAAFDELPEVKLEENVLQIDPELPPALLVPKTRADIILTEADLPQQFHAILHEVSTWETAPAIRLVLRSGKDSSKLATALSDSATTFGLSSPSVALFQDSVELLQRLNQASAGIDIIAGLASENDADAVVAHISSSPQLTAYLSFADVSQYYGKFFTAASASAAFASRVRFASMLPNWATAISGNLSAIEHPVLYDYGKFVNSSNGVPSPSTLHAFVEGRAVSVILNRIIGHVTSTSFYNTWYSVSIITLDNDVALGPYSSSTCTSGSELCECNRGARKVHIRSFFSLVNPESSPLFTHIFAGCMIGYVLPVSSSLSPVIIAFLAIIGVLVVAMVAFAVLFFLRASKARDNTNAPKDSYKPFAVMFTDIQSSTSLWGRVPESMGPGLDKHHSIIRNLIAKYKCYEVKTIGDAFMVVSSDAGALLNVAVELQHKFFEQNWETDAFDTVYKELEQEICDDGGPAPPTANDPNYANHWNGIRVRVGIHFGHGEIIFDEIAKSYDYYGNVVNTASRVESRGHGGQIIVTTALKENLSDNSLCNSMELLGAVALRGVDEPVELWNVVTVRGRTFLEMREEAEEHDSESASQLVSGEGSQADFSDVVLNRNMKIREEVGAAFATLRTAFSTLKEDQHKKTVETLCKQWRVHIPRGRKNEAAKSKDERALWLLAEQIGKVLASRRGGALPLARKFTFMSAVEEGNPQLSQVHSFRAEQSQKSISFLEGSLSKEQQNSPSFKRKDSPTVHSN